MGEKLIAKSDRIVELGFSRSLGDKAVYAGYVGCPLCGSVYRSEFAFPVDREPPLWQVTECKECGNFNSSRIEYASGN